MCKYPYIRVHLYVSYVPLCPCVHGLHSPIPYICCIYIYIYKYIYVQTSTDFYGQSHRPHHHNGGHGLQMLGPYAQGGLGGQTQQGPLQV
jgi:hypothetical protein